jgi:hypothetical protein
MECLLFTIFEVYTLCKGLGTSAKQRRSKWLPPQYLQGLCFHVGATSRVCSVLSVMTSVDVFRSLVVHTFPCHFIYAMLDGGVGGVLCGVGVVEQEKRRAEAE